MARLGGTPATPLTASFLSDCGEVSARVDRLLNPVALAPLPGMRPASIAVAAAMAAGLGGCMLHPSTLAYAYRILEEVIH